MKKIIRFIIFVLSILLIYSLSSCCILRYIYNEQEKLCYSDKTNFVVVEATLCDLYMYDNGCYFFTVENMNYIPLEEKENSYFTDFQSGQFMTNETNSKLLQDLGIEDKLKIGMTFSFISSPSVYDDGYKSPIVAIMVDDDILLDFDTGYKNLMTDYGVQVD